MADVFDSGESCTKTGVYKPDHDAHTNETKVIVAKGDRFPNCKTCGKIEFTLKEVFHHWKEFNMYVPVED